MLDKVLMISVFTFLIHAIETLSYSVRLAGTRTSQLAVSLSLFNIIVILSRTANMVQAPLTASLVDTATKTGDLSLFENQFRIILGSASLGTIMGAILIPTFISIFSRAVVHLGVAGGSVPLMVRRILNIHHLHLATKHFRFPKWRMLSRLRIGGIPKRLFVLNILAIAIYTVGVLAAQYASLLTEYSTTALMSSGLINGFATIILVLFVDPQIAILTDRVMKGTENQTKMTKIVVFLVFSRLIGTLLAQLIFIYAAYYIVWMTKFFI